MFDVSRRRLSVRVWLKRPGLPIRCVSVGNALGGFQSYFSLLPVSLEGSSLYQASPRHRFIQWFRALSLEPSSDTIATLIVRGTWSLCLLTGDVQACKLILTRYGHWRMIPFGSHPFSLPVHVHALRHSPDFAWNAGAQRARLLLASRTCTGVPHRKLYGRRSRIVCRITVAR